MKNKPQGCGLPESDPNLTKRSLQTFRMKLEEIKEGFPGRVKVVGNAPYAGLQLRLRGDQYGN